MRLAMAIGDQRRYRLDEIAPCHFLQTAVRAGYDEESTREILHEVRATAEPAFEAAGAAMPRDTPAVLAEPIGSAIRQRVRSSDLL